MSRMTIVDVLRVRAQAGTEPAIWFEGATGPYDEVSCAELESRARTFARGLAARGVGPGDRVAIVLPTSPEFVYSFYGTLMCGATAVPLYPPAGAHQLAAFSENLARVGEEAHARTVISLPALDEYMAAGLELVPPHELAQATEDDASLPAVAPDDLALIQFSSGSTGAPRGVALTHHNVVANIRGYQSAIAIHPPDVCVSWLPLYHDMGLIGVLIGTVVTQIPLALASPLDFLARPRLWLELLSKYRASIAVSPQFAFNVCLAKIAEDDLEGLDLSAVRVMLNGAEPTDLDVIRRFEQRFARAGLRSGVVTPCYGLAEHALAVSMGEPGRDVVHRYVSRESNEVLPALPGREEPGALEVASDGRPIPGTEVAILDATGEPLPGETIGEIAVRSECVCKGYVTRDGLAAAVDDSGWLRTGDLGFVADGELFAVDRLKDTIVVAGRNVYSHDIERAVTGVRGIRPGRAVVFGVRDPELGTESLVVAAESLPDQREELLRRAAAVRAVVVQSFGLTPRDVVLLPKGRVPLTSSGKVRRHRVRQDYEAGALVNDALVSFREAALAGAARARDEAVA